MKRLCYGMLALGVGALGIYEHRLDKKQEQKIASLEETVRTQQALLDEKASKEENSSQEAKIALLNKYALAAAIILNKNNAGVNELFRNNQELEKIVQEISSKVEDARTAFLDFKAKNQGPENSERLAKTIAPSVKVECSLERGSGTVLYSKQEGADFYSYVLTALHVVQGAVQERPQPIKVTTFNEEGVKDEEFSDEVRLIKKNEKQDLAILEIISDYELSRASLASRERARSIQRFDRVCVVGCPLGYEPFQTEGEITSKNKKLEGQKYWMVNAESIFGNSGGGVFLLETNELIGVITRVSAYNNFVNIAVPHMSIVVSPETIYNWFEKENLQFLYNDSFNRAECLRRRTQLNADDKNEHPAAPDLSTVKPVLK